MLRFYRDQQGGSEGTNNQVRNRFYKSVHLQLFNVQYKFVYLQLFNVKFKFVQLFDVKFLFSQKHIFASRRERMFMDARPLFRVFNSTGKMMTCYLRDRNKFWRSRTLCTNILKCKFPTKGIELTRLELFEGPRGPQL